jgi:erythromycin esterase-like protein
LYGNITLTLGMPEPPKMSRRGEYNVGQLVRERYPGHVFNIGFTTYTGTVTAATDWGADAETKRVRPGMPGSWEELFHRIGSPAFLLRFREHRTLSEQLAGERLERATGVIYRPDTERVSHYFAAKIVEQFDAVIHVDTTRAVEPLDFLWEVSEGARYRKRSHQVSSGWTSFDTRNCREV